MTKHELIKALLDIIYSLPEGSEDARVLTEAVDYINNN